MKKLQWGETPWDDLPRDDLLREVQRMFWALQSAKSILGMFKGRNELSSFWGEQGSGGKALDRSSQIIDPLYQAYDAESVYKAFFRYAASLLFDVPDEEKWLICPVCGGMWSGKRAVPYVGRPCSAYPIASEDGCTGVLRWLEWVDLTKVNEQAN